MNDFLTTATPIFFAIISGMFPVLIWLLFWLKEDDENPEPKNMLALAFVGGMVAVFISLFLEKYFFELQTVSIFNQISPIFQKIATQTNISIDKVLLVIIFAPIIEEILKFVLAYILVLRSNDDDEPIDPMIYMITTALGFAAVENILFLIGPFVQKNDIVLAIFTGNMRFVGSTILHTISSATIAIFLSFHFYDCKIKKIFFVLIGIICSIVIHGIFNYLMLGDQSSSTLALELIWIIVIIILLAFEKIKKTKRQEII